MGGIATLLVRPDDVFLEVYPRLEGQLDIGVQNYLIALAVITIVGGVVSATLGAIAIWRWPALVSLNQATVIIVGVPYYPFLKITEWASWSLLPQEFIIQSLASVVSILFYPILVLTVVGVCRHHFHEEGVETKNNAP